MKLPKSLTTVTPCSKIIALLLFVSLPFIGFSLGVWYKDNNAVSPSAIYQSLGKQTLVTDNLDSRYRQAVTDAETAFPSEIYKNLTAITAENTNLFWNDSGQVLTTTWTTYQGYADYVGKEMNLAQEVWVTVVPEVENFCHDLGFSQRDMILRLEQVLGIPAKSGKTFFVRMWVSPNDLFRPCPDPEINDSECERVHPQSAYGTVSNEYKTWFAHQKSISYGDGGYPWTALGYTYDWGGVASEVGLSEFVIQSGAYVTIENVMSTRDFIVSRCL